MQIGLVLEGGASRGVFTAGALDFLLERGMAFSYIAGTSAGACNAMNFLAGQHGRGRSSMIHTDKRLDYFGLRTLVKTGQLFDLKKAFDTLPNEVFPFDYAAYFANPTPREYAATNCLTGEAAYLREQTNEPAELMRIGMASSAIPGAAKPVVIDGVPYADGGVADSIPVRRALAQGCEKVFIILTRRAGFTMQPSKSVRLIARMNRQKYPALADALHSRPLRYNETLAEIGRLEEAGTAFVLRPTLPEVGRMERGYHALMRFYAHGYRQMEAAYPALLAFCRGETLS